MPHHGPLKIFAFLAYEGFINGLRDPAQQLYRRRSEADIAECLPRPKTMDDCDNPMIHFVSADIPFSLKRYLFEILPTIVSGIVPNRTAKFYRVCNEHQRGFPLKKPMHLLEDAFGLPSNLAPQ